MTPLEENKSFLEKVRLGGLLCGLHEDSIKALTRDAIQLNKSLACVLALDSILILSFCVMCLKCPFLKFVLV